jgi:hypothetical protein
MQQGFGNDPAACQIYDHGSNFSDQQQSPMTFTNQEEGVGLSKSLLDRGEIFPTLYVIQGSPLSARWQVPTGPNIPESVAPQWQSPSYMNPPLASSADVAYSGRFLADERKVALLNSASYERSAPDSVPNRRLMSPSTSTASLATLLPLTSSYHLGYQSASRGHGNTDFVYQAQPAPHCAPVTLRSGVGDVTVSGQHPGVPRYSLASGRSESSIGYLHTDQIIL